MPNEFIVTFMVAFAGGMAWLTWEKWRESTPGSAQWYEKMIATQQSATAPKGWKFGKWEHSHDDWELAEIEADGYVLAVSDESFKGACFHFVLASQPRQEGEDVHFQGGKDYYTANVRNISTRYFRQFHVIAGSPDDDAEFLGSNECKRLMQACKTGERVRIKTKAGKSLTCQPDARFHPVRFDKSLTCPLILTPEVEWATI